jgi:hypothetical protein
MHQHACREERLQAAAEQTVCVSAHLEHADEGVAIDGLHDLQRRQRTSEKGWQIRWLFSSWLLGIKRNIF